MSRRKLLQSIVLPAMLLFSQLCFAQDRVITGRVTDSTGSGVAGVTITAKGTQTATQTTNDGSFRITVPSTVNALIFSSVGFTTREVPVISGSPMMVSLSGVTSSLNEIVVIGYGTSRKKDLTGAVTAITAKDFNKGAITTPEQLIAGKVAGVQITSNGGAPGSGSTIRIRGGASLNASNDPLIVVDGVPLAPNRNVDGTPSIAGSPDPLSLINPNDIESMNILKDASATAIYGSRASNGVIIITTKKGKSGKPRFNFTTQNSISTLPKEADVLSPAEFRNYVNTHGTPAQIAIMGNASTDWQNEIYDNAFTTDNNLSVSGSYKVLPYRVSLGYLNQDGILKTGNLQRTSASITLSPRLLDDHLKIDLNLKGSLSHSRFANEGAIGTAVRFDPTQPVFSGNKRFGGYFEWLDPSSTTGLRDLAPLNPVGLLEQREDKSDVQRSIGNIQFDYKLHFLPDLHVNLNLGYDVSKGEGTIF
ncbi:MAG TPA: SusC/RagA family TonB-linked outer membrane protein, partial [Chitinophagaceae bacterium]|nr:SusC/RagA family TonB-linked outer membrane protein [Chitinophagaceae bacterium]